jgi:NAD(P)-dependent dehydrogenase (short-subunit alcohol dehydrogenase family)
MYIYEYCMSLSDRGLVTRWLIARYQDAGSPDDNARLVKETVEKLGGIDIIIANAGWTRFSDFKDLNALSTEEWNKARLADQPKLLRMISVKLMADFSYSAGHVTSCATCNSCKPLARSSTPIPTEACT